MCLTGTVRQTGTCNRMREIASIRFAIGPIAPIRSVTSFCTLSHDRRLRACLDTVSSLACP